jgi:putative tricarboxylic transport membrane protein
MRKPFVFAVSSVLVLTALSMSVAQQQGALRIMAPAAPGGGWDQTARALQSVMEQANLAKPVTVVNVPGAGGTVGLAQFVNSRGDGNQLMVMGLVMVGAIPTNKSRVTLDSVTPIARLTGEFQVLVVPAESKIQNLGEFLAAWKANPGGTPVAGGSAGGTDHITVGLLAQAGGVDTAKINYVPYAGGGEALAALLGNQVAAGVSSLSEFLPQIQAGKLRALGVSSRAKTGTIASFREQGVRVEISNWRGIVAPPGISDARRRELVELVAKATATPQWKAILQQRGWINLYQGGSAFDVFLKLENERIVGTLKSIGIVK